MCKTLTKGSSLYQSLCWRLHSTAGGGSSVQSVSGCSMMMFVSCFGDMGGVMTGTGEVGVE